MSILEEFQEAMLDNDLRLGCDFKEYLLYYENILKTEGFIVRGVKEVDEAISEQKSFLQLKKSNVMPFIYTKEFDTDLNLISYVDPLKYKSEATIKINDTVLDLTWSPLSNTNKILTHYENLKMKEDHILKGIKVESDYGIQYRFASILKKNDIPLDPSNIKFVDTLSFGIDIKLENQNSHIMECIDGNYTPQSYFEATLLYNQIVNNTLLAKGTIVFKKTLIDDNEYIPGPIYYEDENGNPVIEYHAIINQDFGLGDSTTYNLVINRFDKDTYKFKRYVKMYSAFLNQ